MSTYLWHDGTLLPLLARRTRMPHALLVQAPPGTGLFEFCTDCASALLCEKPQANGEACGSCPGCNWFAQDNHPDYRLVQPESYAEPVEGELAKDRKSDQIRIDQVRALQEFLAVGTHRAGYRVVLLHPADAMNPATQNALLKMLEEPPERTVFLLATASAHRLLPTVRSRCHVVDLPMPAAAEALAWLSAQSVPEPQSLLALAGGAPLLARELAGRSEFVRMFTGHLGGRDMDPMLVAAACQNVQAAEFVTSLYRWCYDVLALKLAGTVRYHAGQEIGLARAGERCAPERLAAFLRTLAEARSLAEHPLNARLFFEDLLIRYRTAIGASA